LLGFSRLGFLWELVIREERFWNFYCGVVSKQGREAWTIFKNPMYRGALEIAQNLYKDKAHFVYELLHNADNQGATHFSMRTKSRNKLNLM
jgi:hypothetical protein